MIIDRALSEIWSSVNCVSRKLASLRSPIVLSETAKVIGVGNLQAGGTGKTPVVIELARKATAEGKKVVILTRGYRSQFEADGGFVVGSDTAQNLDPRTVGDEAALVHEKVPQASIVIGANRAQQYRLFTKRTGIKPDLIIVDDAFQQFRLRQDRKVLLVTSHSRSERVYREFYSAAKEADIIILTKGEQSPFQTPAPRIQLKFTADLEHLKGKSVAALCAIADPAAFEAELERGGCKIAARKRFADHHEYEEEDLREFCIEAKTKGLTLVTTEKDRVKIKNLPIAKEYEFTAIQQKIEVLKGHDLWDTLWQS